MNRYRTINKKINFKEHYSLEEFNQILNIVPKSNLTEPIKRNKKEFMQDIHGFRVSTLPDNKLHSIYIKRIMNDSDPILELMLSKVMNSILDEIDTLIIESIDRLDIVRKKLESDDIVCFEKLVDILLESNIKTNISLYFKLVNLELSDSQEKYCSRDLPIRLAVQQREVELGIQFTKELEDKLKKVERIHNKELQKKEKEMNSVKEEMLDLARNYELTCESNENICSDYKTQLEAYEKNIEDIKKKADKSITNELSKNSELVIQLEKKNKEIHEVKQLLELKEEKFESVFYEKWKSNHKAMTEELNKDIKAIEKLSNSKEIILNEVLELKNDLSELKKSRDYIENNTKELVDHIHSVFEVFDLKANTEKSGDELLILNSEKYVVNSDEINDREDYIEDLKTNLEIVGIGSKFSFTVSQYIHATIANKMGILLIGSDSRLIANAISSITCSRSAELILLPPGFTDTKQLIENVNASKSGVVLIEGAVDNLYESVYLPLLKSNHKKIILFSLDSSENINLIPSAIYDYAMLLDSDSIITFSKNEPLLCAIASEECFIINHDFKMCSKKIDWLNKLDRIIKIKNTTKLKISRIMSTIDSTVTGESEWVILSLYFNLLIDNTSRTNEYYDFVKQAEIPKDVAVLFDKYKGNVS